MKNVAFILVGPTASGKTKISLDLAQTFGMEIVNADSLQVFRHLDIGTAKPSLTDRSKVCHHLIDTLNPDERITAAWYSLQAQSAIRDVLQRHRWPLVVGGSGFYLRALERPPVTLPASSPGHLAPQESLQEAYEILQREDPTYAQSVHANDKYRVMRALFVLRQGYQPSELWAQAKSQKPWIDMHWLGLSWSQENLREQIDRRVDHMLQQGLLVETQEVLKRFPNSKNRLEKAIGYREVIKFLNHEGNLDTMATMIKTASHQYAKRQMTWFRKEERIHWFSRDGIDSIQAFVAQRIT